MISADIQSMLPTIAGQSYILTIANGSGDYITPYVHCQLPTGSVIIVYLTPENSGDPFYWDSGQSKHVTFTAWGHAIDLMNYSPDVSWELRAITD